MAARRSTRKREIVDISADYLCTEKGPFLVYQGPDWLNGASSSVGLACFDFDGTIIATASGRTFYTNRKDWRWTFSGTPMRLKKLSENGTPIVIVSNQNGIDKGKVDRREVEGRFLDVINQAGITNILALFIPGEEGRKPDPRAWSFIAEQVKQAGLEADLASSFFVGDAAGRPAAWNGDKKTKKDFSCTDRKFAANAGLRFLTPEEFFLGASPAKFDWGSIDPAALLRATAQLDPLHDISPRPLLPSPPRQELILLVGPPASGKSSLYQRVFQPAGYVHVSRDILGTQPKCHRAVVDAFDAGKSVVVDNTSPSLAGRLEYISLAQSRSIPVRCLRFIVDLPLAHHLNAFRAKTSDRPKVPAIGFNMYKSHFAEPCLEEGFQDILPITFIPQFSSEEEKSNFLQWTE